MTSRGLRNNNPGNLRDQGIPWQGVTGADADGYLIFDTALNGIRAIARDLWTKFHKDGLRTVAAIIAKYAPPEDRNDTGAYVAAVAKALGVEPLDPLHMDMAQMPQFVRAIINHENGSCPYSSTLIAQAITLALPKGTGT